MINHDKPLPTSLNSKAKVLFWVSVLIVLISGAFVQKKKVSGRAVKIEAVLGVKHYNMSFN